MPIADTSLLIDTGPIVASLVSKESSHVACNEILDRVHFAYTCWPVITEAVYLLGDYSPAVEKLFALLHNRIWQILSIDHHDLAGIETILMKYRDQGFQLADACLMYLSERECIMQVLTLDKKDFGLFRTTGGKSLTLFP